MEATRTLTHDEARRFYDRLGRRQDTQAFYEDRATGRLIALTELDDARSIVEFGCGTGRFAKKLLEHHLASDARYLAVDASATMVAIARTRLVPFGRRATVVQSDGSPVIDIESQSADRFLSTFVLDLLSENDIAAVIEEAQRILVPGGMLGLVSLTHGFTPVTRALMLGWQALHSVRPALVGGCRPIELQKFVGGSGWLVEHHERMSAFGVPSEILVAHRLSG